MSPQFVVSPSDLERAVGAVRQVGNPAALVGRLMGLGTSEMRAGIPAWAWALLAFGAGAYVGAQHLPAIREKLGFH